MQTCYYCIVKYVCTVYAWSHKHQQTKPAPNICHLDIRYNYIPIDVEAGCSFINRSGRIVKPWSKYTTLKNHWLY